MKRAVTLGLLLVSAVFCLAQSHEKATQPRNADDLLKSFAQRVHAELLPRASELTQEEVFQSVGAIAVEVLVPNKELLFEKAKAELAELPKLTIDLGDGWETVEKVEQGIIANRFAAELGHGTSQPVIAPLERDAVLLVHFWNPRAAARTVRTGVIVRHLGPKDYGQRAMIEAFAPPIAYAISSDPQHPIIAIETGPELFVVSLKRTAEGYYVDERIQWLKKKGAASQPAAAGPRS